MNSENFNHFKLYADSTLKQMTKSQLIDYIHMLHHNWRVTDEFYCRAVEYNQRQSKALHNAIKECCIGISGSDACNSLDELYKAFEKKVWEDVK